MYVDFYSRFNLNNIETLLKTVGPFKEVMVRGFMLKAEGVNIAYFDADEMYWVDLTDKSAESDDEMERIAGYVIRN